jgi:hypothetical protein
MKANKFGRSNKRYALLHRQRDGSIVAMIDMPMRMGWSKTKAYLWNEPPYHYRKGNHFIVRVGSDNCPIKVTKNRARNNKFIMRST